MGMQERGQQGTEDRHTVFFFQVCGDSAHCCLAPAISSQPQRMAESIAVK